MLARSVIEIIEKMGFVYEDENRWVADFMFDLTGNVLTIIAYEGQDECGLSRVLFNACDDKGDLLSTSTLDQIMFEYERGNIIRVPIKSHKRYKVGVSMYVVMPVDMDAVFPETYRMYIEEGCRTEEEIAKRVAKADIVEYCNGAPFTQFYTSVESIEEIKE